MALMTSSSLDRAAAASRSPIAIVGIGCRLPGAVDGPEALWTLLGEGRDAIGPIPPNRFDVDALYDERPGTPGRISNRVGGYLDDIDQFDAGFFAVSHREAEVLDPQQRLLLETSWESLEDAGLRADELSGTRTGVFVGMWTNEYESRMFADTDRTEFHMTTGTGRYAASGRISYFLDLLGPSVTIDTACSSSLVAVHLASNALSAGDCDVALAGGATVIVEPYITIAYSQSRMMAPDGRCKFGDASANGYVRSEGAVMIALKRLDDALASGDRVYAVIRGSAVTSDGRGSGSLGTPARAGQEEMLREAYRSAGVDPSTVHYIEAHGTGTPAGDPVEFGSLGAVVGAGRTADEPCLVGSIKSNIGHTEGAAGAAGLVKLALSLHHEQIPASLHVVEPNPAIPWDLVRMRIVTEPTSWPRSETPRRGGVSAFGIAGTNAHVVMEEAPTTDAVGAPELPSSDLVLPISASDDAALDELGERYATLLESRPDDALAICGAAATRRSRLGRRRAVVGRSSTELVRQLRHRSGQPVPAELGNAPSIVYVFPGQGSQWAGMARELLAADSEFAAAMDECDLAIRNESDWSPIEMLMTDDHPRIDDIDVVQPLLFAIEVSLAAAWRRWGAEPSAVVGHSMGEVAAAHVAGVLSLADAVAVICRRSALLRRLSGRGAMAVVDLSVDAADEKLVRYHGRLSIAVANSRRSTVISGDPDALDELLGQLEADEVFCRRVQVDVASHSPQVDPLLAELRSSLADIEPMRADVPFHSTVTGTEIDGTTMGADYWCDNLRRTVRFVDVIENLAGGGAGAFVELSPHPILLPAIEQTIDDAATRAVCIASLRRDQPERMTMLAGLAELFEHGFDPDWGRVFVPPVAHIDLPKYPWQRSQFWHERPSASHRGSQGHGLLGRQFVPADEPDVVIWERTLALETDEYLADHVVRGAPLVPATFLIELMRAAARHQWSETDIEIEGIRLHRMLPLDAEGVQVQVRWESQGERCGRVQIRATSAELDEWMLHAEGELRCVEPDFADRERGSELAGMGAPPLEADSGAHSAVMQRRGLAYGPAFSCIESSAASERVARAVVVVEGPVDDAERAVRMLDAALQNLIAALPAESVSPSATYVPVAVGAATLAGATWPDRADVTATITSIDLDAGTFCGDLVARSGHRTLASMRSVRFEQVGRGADLDELVYNLAFLPAERRPVDDLAPSSWLIFSDGVIGPSIVAELERRGVPSRLVDADPDAPDIATIIDEMTPDGGVLGVVDLRANRQGADDPTGAGLLRSTVVLLQTLAAHEGATDFRLWLVTVDGVPPAAVVDTEQSDASDLDVRRPFASMAWGLGRVAASEFPGLGCTLVDIGSDDIGVLVDELLASDGEPEVVVRGADRRVARLERRTATETRTGLQIVSDEYRLAAETPGSLEGLRLRHQPRREPAAGEVEIRVEAAGLNFIDVMKAMGIYPGVVPGPDLALGAECSGVIVAVGHGVDDLAVGDSVVAITPSYSETALLGSHATLGAEFVVRRPTHLAASEAAALPVAYVTAQQALEEIARIREGDQVLIHSATGGVGLAAIEICRANGADVIATAGSPNKRELLRSMGISRVFDSRSTEFADDVLESTSGRGVDIVLNSLAGPAIEAGLSTLAAGGRFVEIGKRDLWGGTRLVMGSLRDNQSFSVLDLAGLTTDSPAAVARSLRSVVERVGRGELAPLPVTAAPLSEAIDSFRTMAAAGHTGKLVLEVEDAACSVTATAIRPGVTYLITGGTGALGTSTAARLAARGADHLALIARGTPNAHARTVIDEIERSGVTVKVLTADVGDRDAVLAAVDEIRAAMPPLAGVFHAAGTLSDATIPNIDADGWREAIVPKVAGALHLHEATDADALELFVMYSSVAGSIGLPGQANYASANAFLDAFAVERRRSGRAGLSIAWGPWAGVGLAAVQEGRGDRLATQGMEGLVPTEALDVLDRLLDGATDGDPIVMRFDANRWVEANPASAALVGDLVSDGGVQLASGAGEATFAEQLQRVPGGPRRRAAAEGVVRERLASVLRTPPELIDPNRPVKAMGLDSLMALELRNQLERDTGLTLSATLAWNHPTVVLMAAYLADKVGISLDTASAAVGAGTPVGDGASEESDSAASQTAPEGVEMTEADLAALLDEELDEIDRLLDNDGTAT